MEAALPDMLEEAVSIIEDDVKMRESDEIKKRALGPAARAVSARTSMPAHCTGAPGPSQPLGVGSATSRAEPSLGASLVRPSLPPPPSRPHVAKKFANG